MTSVPEDKVAPHLSVVIPAFNEEGRIGATLGALVFDHAIYADETESDEAFDYVMRKIELAQKAVQREEAQRRDQNEDRG